MKDILPNYDKNYNSAPLPLGDCVAIIICHPEFISGSHKSLILLDAETSSA
jgi:hypothetical protein